MGLDLYALSKKESFDENEVQKLIKEKKELDKKWDLHLAFVEEVCQKLHGQSISEFFEEYTGTEDESEIDKLYDLPEVVKNKKELGIPDPEDLYSEGITNNKVLNYYFDHCYNYCWDDEELEVDTSLLKNESNHEWIPYGPHHASDDETSLMSLLDDNSLLAQQHVPEAIKRIKSRKSIDMRDLRLIAFLEKYQDHFFAFL